MLENIWEFISGTPFLEAVIHLLIAFVVLYLLRIIIIVKEKFIGKDKEGEVGEFTTKVEVCLFILFWVIVFLSFRVVFHFISLFIESTFWQWVWLLVILPFIKWLIPDKFKKKKKSKEEISKK